MFDYFFEDVDFVVVLFDLLLFSNRAISELDLAIGCACVPRGYIIEKVPLGWQGIFLYVVSLRLTLETDSFSG